MLLILKIILQVFAFALAILLSGLDYWWHDKRTTRFKQARRALIAVAVIFMLGGITLTVFDDRSNNHKEQTLTTQLAKVQEQNDGLQKGIAVLSGQSSNILEEQRTRFITVLSEQEKKALQTSTKIDLSTGLLHSGITNSIQRQQELLQAQQTILANITSENSYCYVFPFLGTNAVVLSLAIDGNNPIYDVVVEIMDERAFYGYIPYEGARRTHSEGTIRLGPRLIDRIELPDTGTRTFSITINTRYKLFVEKLLLVKVNGNWRAAYLVFDMTGYYKDLKGKGLGPALAVNEIGRERLMVEYIQPGFPTDANGRVDFGSLLPF